MVVAALLFTVMAASVKVAREELSALEVMVFRAGTAIPLSLTLALRGGQAQCRAEAAGRSGHE